MNVLRWFTATWAGFPRWIWVHLVLVVAATAAGAYAGWVGEPEILFADFDGVALEPPLRFLTDLWSSKNIAYLTIIAASIALKSPQALGAVLGMKFVNDTLDQLLFTPRHLPDGELTAMIAPWLVMTLPMAVASWVLLFRPRRREPTTPSA